MSVCPLAVAGKMMLEDGAAPEELAARSLGISLSMFRQAGLTASEILAFVDSALRDAVQNGRLQP